ncbi:hypothetical protein VTK73DRAFT_1919 [Phialemonium thermophilum]|uniref:FAD dependent oxidoreductase domain-containing protein n=1 Tax=Phialemonium thermophilum TaxID=223376 RepID=A0ABR3Y339_9PEZI
MGSVISAPLGAAKALRAVISTLRDIAADYNALHVRVNAKAELPVPSPTEPYWLRDPPYPELVDTQSPSQPSEADVVIIGSGIAGAAVAWSLLHGRERGSQESSGSDISGPPLPSVVVLEARQMCSGATGRNGGHIKASPHETFARLRKKMPPERAAAVVRFQLSHLETIVDLCRHERIDQAEAREVETVDLYLSKESYDQAVRQVEELQIWVPEFRMTTWTASEAQKHFNTNSHVEGAISYRAGALWPYRFVTSIWRKLLDKFPKSLRIETGTPVLNITSRPSSTFPYEITTSRGVIRCSRVVHATNAYASHLIPGLKGKLTGLVAHMSSQRPGKDFPHYDGKRSWSIIYGTAGFDYVTQRPGTKSAPGDILLGGGFCRSRNQGLDHVGVYDDSKRDALTTAHILGVFPTIFEPNWGRRLDGLADKVWTGVIGVVADFRPLVGRLDSRLTGRRVIPSGREETEPGQPGEWVAAGFIGDGMVWAWLSGTAIGVMVSGREDEDLPAAPGIPSGKLHDWFPVELLPEYGRVKRMDMTALADEIA